MAIAILALHKQDLPDSSARTKFIDTFLGHTDEPVLNVPHLYSAYKDLYRLNEAVKAFTPLYVQWCMKKLDHIEAVRAHGPGNRSRRFGDLSSGVRILRRPYRYHWRWNGDRMIAEREEYPDLNPNWEERSRAKKLEATPYRWRLPAAQSEIYRIQRAFWRFHLYCKLFGERPTMDTGTDASLSLDRKLYLARLQNWEYEEMASILPFVSTILEAVYKPGVYSDPKVHNVNSLASLEAWKAEYGPDSDAEHYDDLLQGQLYIHTHWDCPIKPIARDKPNAQIRWYGDLLQRKWIAHQVSGGLVRVYRYHIQRLKDAPRIIRRHYPEQLYKPWLFVEAPIEAIMRWRGPWEHQYFYPWGANHVATHCRTWPDAPEAHEPGYCWRMKRSIFGGGLGYGWDNMYCYSSDCRALREVGYFFWDERPEEREAEPDRGTEHVGQDDETSAGVEVESETQDYISTEDDGTSAGVEVHSDEFDTEDDQESGESETSSSD